MSLHANSTTHCLPRGWRLTTLGESCRILAGFGFPERLQGRVQGEIPFFKVGDISEAWKRNERFLKGANHYISHADASSIRARPLPPNTIVFAKIGAAIALNRRAMLSKAALVDNNVMGLSPASDDLDACFLFHYACTLKLDELSRATTVPSVRKSDIENISLPLPPVSEQHRIVSEVEKQLTRLEAGVASLKRVQAALKRYRASVMKAACEGRLVPTEAELARREGGSYETGEQLLDRILKERRGQWESDRLARLLTNDKSSRAANWKGEYHQPASPTVTPGFGPELLPTGWVLASLEQLTSATRVICYGILMPKENVAHGIPYVKVKDIKGDRINVSGLHRTSSEIAAAYARASLKAGDLLLAIRGTYGRVAEVPTELNGGNITQDTARLDVTSLVDRRYIAIHLRSEDSQSYFRRVARGVAVKGVNIGEVRPAPIAVPPFAEQRRIVAEVERRLSVIDELETLVTASVKRAERLRQSILHRAFTGKLVRADIG